MPASQRTRDYQRQQRVLRALTYADVMTLWPMLDMERLDETFPRFAAATGAVVVVRRRLSQALARSYLTAVRGAAGAAGLLPPVPDPPPVPATFVTALRGASVVSVKRAMMAGRPPDLASRNALVNTMGAADRAVADAGRDVIRTAVDRDPAARGWTRVTSGGCDWCESLADGSVLPGSAEMVNHPHCGCAPQPVFV